MTEQASAVLSPDRKYRYRLDRWWGDGERLVWVMLNPSTADENEDDPTIRRVRSFTKREGYDGFTVVNVFGYRATDPRDLFAADDPKGPDNDDRVAPAIRDAPVVLAWGARGGTFTNASASWMALYARATYCLGKTKAGHPRHPLYLATDTPLEPWS